MSQRIKSRKGQGTTVSKGRSSAIGISAGLVVLGVLVLGTLALAGLTNWRSLPVSRAALPVGMPQQMPANAPNREYVYAGNSLIATSEPFREPPSDLAIWRPKDGIWWILSGGSPISYQWGESEDKPAPGDFDGDGKTDFGVFRESDGTWYIICSSNEAVIIETFGERDDVPVAADYDGDGRSDIAVFRPSEQKFYVKRSSDGGFSYGTFQNTLVSPTAAPGDFDGDGKTDFAVWESSTHTFVIKGSIDNAEFSRSVGSSGGKAVIGDYDGDGKSDPAVINNVSGSNYWQILPSDGSTAIAVYFGLSSDIPVPARYTDAQDTDAKTDIAVWRPDKGYWYILRSSNGVQRTVQWGQDGDIPMPAAWRR